MPTHRLEHHPGVLDRIGALTDDTREADIGRYVTGHPQPMRLRLAHQSYVDRRRQTVVGLHEVVACPGNILDDAHRRAVARDQRMPPSLRRAGQERGGDDHPRSDALASIDLGTPAQVIR
jgi:hypothetical protein